jgi:hypothetical protein
MDKKWGGNFFADAAPSKRRDGRGTTKTQTFARRLIR